MSKNQRWQEPFLNQLRLEHTKVNIYLASKVKIRGKIFAFDDFGIQTEDGQYLYKSAITTIVPSVNFKLSYTEVIEDATNITLQDEFLFDLRDKNVSAYVFLSNGIRFVGSIRGFDSYVIILDGEISARRETVEESPTQLIYKHSVASVRQNFDLAFQSNNRFKRENA